MYQEKQGPTPDKLERWRLTGSITTSSPMHIGDGGWKPMADIVPKRKREEEDKRDPQGDYATVFRDATGKPVIPGSSLKGALRAWALAHGVAEADVEALFGHLKGGGPVTFHDAPLSKVAEPKWTRDPGETAERYWDPARATYITPHVVINPATRSAKEHLLFCQEEVPAGTEFAVRITAQGVPEAQRRLLLFILDNAFVSGSRPALLGSHTANGHGSVRWRVDNVQTFDLEAWLDGPMRHWTEALEPLAEPARSEWLRPLTAPATSGTRSVSVRLKLLFSGPMVVNDPTRERTGEKPIGRAPLRGTDGKPSLPASSVRGALRSQCRRIWQTLAWDRSGDLNKGGIPASAPRRGSEARLQPFLKMFGATGWRSPIEVSDFTLDKEVQTHVQEFVAIDRFTGSVAGDKKFNAHGLARPVFAGTLRIRVDRWEAAGAGDWVWLLLIFALRDWMEGDGAIGYGAAKGWGHFRTEVDVEGDGGEADLMRRVLRREPAALADSRLDEWERLLQAEMGQGVA